MPGSLMTFQQLAPCFKFQLFLPFWMIFPFSQPQLCREGCAPLLARLEFILLKLTLNVTVRLSDIRASPNVCHAQQLKEEAF